jgi:hypothetical protein
MLRDAAVHRRFVELLAARDGLPLLARLPCEQTPTGGYQYGYLCPEWAAGTVLARGDTKTATLIDTRGEGDLCAVAPTPGDTAPPAEPLLNHLRPSCQCLTSLTEIVHAVHALILHGLEKGKSPHA